MPNALTPDDLLVLNRAATIARLLAGVTHDVNNSLLVIGGSVELLEDLSLPQAALTRIARIRTHQDRAATVIRNLLGFARERADVVGRIGLQGIVTRAVELRAYAISRAGLTITVDAPASVSFITTGNAMELQQAILNLIANAEEALAGNAQGAIRVQLVEEGGQIVVRVSDNGPGVPPDIRSQVFEPLFTTRPRTEAAGIGLAVARLIAERSGGTLDLEETESGASFVMRLPKG